MLARRGVAGSLVVLSCSALLAAAAMWSPDQLAVRGTIVAIAWLVLAAAVAFVLMVAIHSEKSDQATEQSGPSAASTDDLVGMLWDSVLLARSPRANIASEPVDVPALVADIARKYPDLSVAFSGGMRAMVAESDPRALGHAFDILIDNACANAQRVAIQCDCGTSMLVVHIDDNGPGIPRNLRQRVFERQYYLSTPPSQRPGCSAALIIAHQNARASGGNLSISASPLGGARFTLSLPLLDARTGPVAAAPHNAAA
jgi:signal transduction histidine kinase